MTINPLRSRPRVEIPDRPKLSKREKAAIWNAQNGLCPRCLKPVAFAGLDVQYDHDDPREISGDDSQANLVALHTWCHADKTSSEDRPRITKAHRQEKLTRPKERKRGGFRQWRRFDGSIVKRGER